MNEANITDFPQARVERVVHARWVWLIPLLAGVFAVALIVTYVVKRGPMVVVSMPHGHGLKAGDVVRARGVVVGTVEEVRLVGGADGLGVEATVRLEPSARDIARVGSRFWVVRPTVTLGGVSGLETIAGPRYLAVIPGAASGNGERQSRFVALDEPPVIEEAEPGGLEVTLTAARRGSLQPGAPVMYRQVVIGTILSVGLSADAAGVEVRAYIRPAYSNLARTNSRFWNASGASFEATIRGLRIDLESLVSLIEGGVSMATPDEPGEPVHTGHRFRLAPKADDDWLEWRPAMAVGAALLPPGTSPPDMQRITASRRMGLFKRTRQLSGWALATAEGLIGPSDLLKPSDQTTHLEVAGQSIDLTQESKVRTLNDQLTLLPVSIASARPWPADLMRTMTSPEDCLIAADPTADPIPLPAIRLRKEGESWRIDPSVSFEATTHGAAVMAQSDGKIVGLLLVKDGGGIVAPLAGPAVEN